MAKKASDFRYNTGETKVPWAAVGENYNAQDLMAIVRFLMKGEGAEYDAAIPAVEENVYALDKVDDDFKLSLGAELELTKNLVWPTNGLNDRFYAIPTLAAKWTF